MNRCRYRLRLDNVDPPYKGKLGISCSEPGDSIEIEVREGEAVVCTQTVGPQAPLPGVALTNVGEGAERGVEIDWEVEKLGYQLSGAGCGKTGKVADAGFCGHTTFLGANANDEQKAVFIVGEEVAQTHVEGGSGQPHFANELNWLSQLGTRRTWRLGSTGSPARAKTKTPKTTSRSPTCRSAAQR